MATKAQQVRTADLLKSMLIELQQLGGEARFGELVQAVKAKYPLTEFEKGVYEKTGYIRWQSHVLYASVDCVKAGYIRKADGKWFLTEDGAKMLSQPAAVILRSARERYRRTQDGKQEVELPLESVDEERQQPAQISAEMALTQARTGLRDYVNNQLTPYQFQDLVAELLAAMGYHIRYIARPGKDGGQDIVAHRDRFDLGSPRLKVQVKHHKDKVGVEPVRALHGILKDNEIGLFVCSGGFSVPVKEEVLRFARHIELMDLDTLLDLWQEHYEHVSAGGRALLPLTKVYFLAPIEE